MRKFFKWYWGRRWRRWGTIGGVVFVVGSVISVEVTSHSHFCGTCHIMEPYFESWEHGSHKDIGCVKCHIEPGAQSFLSAKLNGLGQVVDDALNRTSNKPSASVSALSCTRSGCHSMETLNDPDKEVLGDNFRFQHGKHVGTEHLGVEITCGTCHSHVKGDKHFEVNTNVCITCHMIEHEPNGHASPGGTVPVALRMKVRSSNETAEGGPEHPEAATDADGEPRPPSSCLTCHEPPRDTFEYNGLKVDHYQFLAHGASCESCHLGATAAPPPIDDGACLDCHTFGIERVLETKEMHQVHTLGRHKIECFSCHGTVRHGPEAMVMSLEQFNCRKCHEDQHTIQRRAYLDVPSGVIPDHSTRADVAINPMFLAHVDCTGCHTQPRSMNGDLLAAGTVKIASAKSCDACHKPGLGDQMVPLWQSTTRKLYDEAMAEFEAIEQDELDENGRTLLKEARGLLDLVRLDGSWGVHNPKYTQGLIEDARNRIREATQGPAAGESP